MNNLRDTGRPGPTHYGVLIYLGDSAGGAPGQGPQINYVASGDESTCWAAIKQWTATHQLRSGEHVEVLARTSVSHWPIADEREEAADARERVADEREEAADRREAPTEEWQRGLERQLAELEKLVRVIRATSTDLVVDSGALLDATHARTKAAVERSRDQTSRALARARREQAGIDRQAAATRRQASTHDYAGQPPRRSPTRKQPGLSTTAPNGIAPAPGTL